MTKNLHLEHPEDQILTGDMSVLDWFGAVSNVSVKMDGAPAIVWGTNPENGKFFVGTKSVFNKVKIKICYTHEDIFTIYSKQEDLAEILSTCLDFLPRTDSIYQGDFIGYGGDTKYTPNTVTYDFGSNVDAIIIVCPHTEYSGTSLREVTAKPLEGTLDNTDDVVFVQPTVDCTERFLDSAESIRNSVSKSNFLSVDEAKEARIIINAFIREGKTLSPFVLEEVFGDHRLMVSYFQIIDLKEQMMESMKIYDGPKAFIKDQPIDAEGFVRSNEYGTMKLVDRYQFSRANFTNGRFQASA